MTKKKKRKKDKDWESVSYGPSVDIFEESESEFSWTKRKLPILHSRPHLITDMLERMKGAPKTESSEDTESSDSLMTRSFLQIDSKVDNAAKDYYSCLRKKEEVLSEGHRPNPTITTEPEKEANKYPFREFQFRIAEEEAIKSDEDVSIRGRRQARKNKLVLNMIKEMDAYLLRETIDNNRQKVVLRKKGENKIVVDKDDESEAADKADPPHPT